MKHGWQKMSIRSVDTDLTHPNPQSDFQTVPGDAPIPCRGIGASFIRGNSCFIRGSSVVRTATQMHPSVHKTGDHR